jgi:hypothetical protein
VLPDGCLPAPDVYRIVAATAELGYGLPQALTQLAAALHRSLTVFDVYDGDGEPGHNVAVAIEAMTAAADSFAVAALRLSDAQNAIAHQGINEDGAGNLLRRPGLRLAGPPTAD